MLRILEMQATLGQGQRSRMALAAFRRVSALSPEELWPGAHSRVCHCSATLQRC